MFSCSAAALPFHLGQEFSFSACDFVVFRTQRMCWEKMFRATAGISEVWWARAALGAPLDPSTSQLVWLTLLGRCSMTAAGSWCFQHQVMEEDEWAGIWGTLHIIFKVVLITVLCIAVILVRHWILIFQIYFLQQFWPEAVLIVSLQLICQGQTSLLAFLVVFHKEFMQTGP